MPSPLTDAEMEFTVKRVSELLAGGTSKHEIVKDIASVGWDEREAAQFVDEIEEETREVGRAPRGCRILRERATRGLRLGVVKLVVGLIAMGIGYLVRPDEAGVAIGAAIFLWGLADTISGAVRLVKHRD